jgi:hypothetical protein
LVVLAVAAATRGASTHAGDLQDPLASFDPWYTVERVLSEALQVAGIGRGARG